MRHGSNNPLISSVPKPLLEINGVAIVRRIIENLNSDNVSVAVVINPVDEEIFNEKLDGLRFQYYYQSSPKGTADALYATQDFISTEIFVEFISINEIGRKNLQNFLIQITIHLTVTDFARFLGLSGFMPFFTAIS